MEKKAYDVISSTENYCSDTTSNIRVMQPRSPEKEQSIAFETHSIKEFNPNVNSTHTDHSDGVSPIKPVGKNNVNSQDRLQKDTVKIELQEAKKNTTIVVSNLSSEENLGVDL
jgi:hypothetical protein